MAAITKSNAKSLGDLNYSTAINMRLSGATWQGIADDLDVNMKTLQAIISISPEYNMFNVNGENITIKSECGVVAMLVPGLVYAKSFVETGNMADGILVCGDYEKSYPILNTSSKQYFENSSKHGILNLVDMNLPNRTVVVGKIIKPNELKKYINKIDVVKYITQDVKSIDRMLEGFNVDSSESVANSINSSELDLCLVEHKTMKVMKQTEDPLNNLTTEPEVPYLILINC